MWVRILGGLGLVLLIAAGALWGFGGSNHHKATCWKPTYAAAPKVAWAKSPSETHRHGKGPLGSNVCG